MMQEVTLKKEFIELFILLKLEGLAASGGEAKFFVDQGQVTVNGVVEKRKRKKLLAGDIVEFAGTKIIVKAGE